MTIQMGIINKSLTLLRTLWKIKPREQVGILYKNVLVALWPSGLFCVLSSRPNCSAWMSKSCKSGCVVHCLRWEWCRLVFEKLYSPRFFSYGEPDLFRGSLLKTVHWSHICRPNQQFPYSNWSFSSLLLSASFWLLQKYRLEWPDARVKLSFFTLCFGHRSEKLSSFREQSASIAHR